MIHMSPLSATPASLYLIECVAGQWRIQYFPEGARQLQRRVQQPIIWQYFLAGNWMKMEEIAPREGCASLALPWIRHIWHTLFCRKIHFYFSFILNKSWLKFPNTCINYAAIFLRVFIICKIEFVYALHKISSVITLSMRLISVFVCKFSIIIQCRTQ